MFHFDKDLKKRPQAILDLVTENLCIILLKVVLKLSYSVNLTGVLGHTDKPVENNDRL